MPERERGQVRDGYRRLVSEKPSAFKRSMLFQADICICGEEVMT